MTAFIEGSVQTPTGRIVPMTVHAKPIPEPGRLADGNVLVSGNVAAGVRAPISAALLPGRYRLQVFTPAGLLAEREMDLVEGQHVTIAELLEPTTPPIAAPAPGGAVRPLPEGWDTL